MYEDVAETLEKEAKEKGISVNTLVSLIMQKYAEWDRFIEKYPFVTVTRDGFKTLLDAVDEEKLVKIGQDLGSRLPKDFQSFWFKKLTAETFLAHQRLYAKYARTAAVEYEVQGRGYVETVHHELGMNWSSVQKIYVSTALRTLFGIVPQIDITPNSIVIRFTTP